jgi:geranylgeranylglycerol-phosphate geranylgeranyltransferase
LKKLNGFIKLTRFDLPFSAGVCVVMGQMLALGEFASILLTIYAFSSVFLISSSILVLNDYFDVESDKINAPHRPIPSKLVTPKEALYFAIILFLSGLLASALINFISIIIVLILSIIGFIYNRYLKKSGLPGNLLVSFSVGMTFIYGGATVGFPFNNSVIFFSIIAGLIDLGEEIAADVMDAEGDRLINSNSLAIKYGKKFALKVSSVIFILVIFISFIPFLLNWFTPIYLFPIGILDIAILYSTYRLVKTEDDKGRKYIRLLYLGATSGLIIFLIMRLFGL